MQHNEKLAYVTHGLYFKLKYKERPEDGDSCSRCAFTGSSLCEVAPPCDTGYFKIIRVRPV